MKKSVDPRAVDEMARLCRMLQSATTEQLSNVHANASSPTAPSKGKSKLGETSDLKDDMKNIMEIFNRGSTKVAEKISEQPSFDRQLREALVTKVVDGGMQMGSWKIDIKETRGIKTYDLTNVHTNIAIAKDLTLYESALCLCKLLNFHVSINSPQIKEVLALEEEYSLKRYEAATFKHRIKQRREAGDYERADVAEDRYQQARQQALNLREAIILKSKIL